MGRFPCDPWGSGLPELTAPPPAPPGRFARRSDGSLVEAASETSDAHGVCVERSAMQDSRVL